MAEQEQKYEISQESLICITQGHDLIAVIRRNGDIVAHSTKRMTFDGTAQLLARMVGQPPFKLEKD